jgi:hypothetical protein
MSFEIFRDGAGHWCARRSDGQVCGTFRERRDAERFARRECGGTGLVVWKGWGVQSVL